MGMPRSQVNKDPAVARKRAKTDARCAFKKLDLLLIIESWAEEPGDAYRTREILEMIAKDLGIEVEP